MGAVLLTSIACGSRKECPKSTTKVLVRLAKKVINEVRITGGNSPNYALFSSDSRLGGTNDIQLLETNQLQEISMPDAEELFYLYNSSGRQEGFAHENVCRVEFGVKSPHVCIRSIEALALKVLPYPL